MFDRAWLERELAGLIVQLHQIEGAIQVLQQMLKQLEGAGQPAPGRAYTLEEFGDLLPPGVTVEGEVQTYEDIIHP